MQIIKSKFKFKYTALLTGLVLNAWPHLYKKFPHRYAIHFSKAYIKYCQSISDWNEFVFIGNELVACIFCHPVKGFSVKIVVRLFTIFFKYLILWLFGYFGKINALWGFIKANSRKEKFLVKGYHNKSYEISLILVHSDYRNNGFGKILINNFEQHAKNKGFTEIVLTSDELSNWEFYGKIGFYKSYQCFDPVSSYLDDSKQHIFVYKKQI